MSADLADLYLGRWYISHDPPPIPDRRWDWSFHHVDYDGPEDNRCGHAESYAACCREIDEIEAEAVAVIGMSVHTPGPWSVAPWNVNSGSQRITGPGGDSDPIANVWGGNDEALANAALIASAPDLLAALRLTEGNLSSLIAAKHSNEVLMTPWVEAVRAEIAKATQP